ncbi:GntR family transcriptional regulator [Spelaeicoccus albus]|uniref:DNA-binding GntR family transcriptional regulator n=1 Tax=Spelaeicoccus albus TaxID=1280376 RepID=A0A7Z0AA06_9MICO|nr:GntR family transcriptional regulator [Spelaeicoccus albus]NYI67097.1 DNA-binding GntR family transcriptional regulator [Spelaeicoccus albus]
MTESFTPGAGPTRGDALVDQAFRILRDEILRHELLPGSRLSVPEVARRLNISRSPAREAITRIAFDGLADFVPHKGAIVASIGAEDLVHIYQLREVLEGLAGRIAAEQIDDAGLSELENILEAHTVAVRTGDVETHMELDARFHRVIRESSDNSRLIESLNRLQGQVRLAMATTHLLGGGMEKALSEHRTIIDSLKSGDPGEAEKVSRNHIERLRHNLETAARSETKETEKMNE